MADNYDDQNIFAKILRGELPNTTVMETEHTLAFRDITPQAPEHIIVIPKGPYVNYDHFAREASSEEIVDFTRTIGAICAEHGFESGQGGYGYRLISNSGEHGLQEVPHLHMHILAGRVLGPILIRN